MSNFIVVLLLLLVTALVLPSMTQEVLGHESLDGLDDLVVGQLIILSLLRANLLEGKPLYVGTLTSATFIWNGSSTIAFGKCSNHISERHIHVI